MVELANGITLLVPAQVIRGLQTAAAHDCAEIDIIGVGSGLYWPRLDMDISVVGLLAGASDVSARSDEVEMAA